MTVEAQQALVKKYCAGCHSGSVKSGGFSLNSVDLAHPDRTAENAENVIRKLRAGMMPPSGLPRPERATLDAFAASIENAVDLAAARNPNPGRPALHRLNRTEYENSVRDLLDLNCCRVPA
jgi:mono/diheme cytochrome c family protein